MNTETTPFNSAAMFGANLGHSLSIDLLVRTVHAYEADLADRGHGVPPLDSTIELSLMWGSIVEQASDGEH